MQVVLQKNYRYEVTEDDKWSVFNITQTDNGHVRVSATANDGQMYVGTIPKAGEGVDMLEAIKNVSLDKLIAALDPFGMVYQRIDPELIIQVLTEKAEALGLDRAGAIRNASQFSTMANLHNFSRELMNELFGHNWPVEQAAELVGKSAQYNTVRQLAGTLKSVVG